MQTALHCIWSAIYAMGCKHSIEIVLSWQPGQSKRRHARRRRSARDRRRP